MGWWDGNDGPLMPLKCQLTSFDGILRNPVYSPNLENGLRKCLLPESSNLPKNPNRNLSESKEPRLQHVLALVFLDLFYVWIPLASDCWAERGLVTPQCFPIQGFLPGASPRLGVCNVSVK